jgi:deoxycytidine triphosphate deaminase
MSVINLRHRVTYSLDEFEQRKRSENSLIYVDRDIALGDGDASLDLTVGAAWVRETDNVRFTIEQDGLALKPGQSYVVETRERIGVPADAFGLVTGKGKYIFQGVLVSPGKMDPGFCEILKIGLYNAGHSTVAIKKNEPFCTVCFLELEPSFDRVRSKGDLRPEARAAPRRFPTREKIGAFVKRDWGWIASILIAVMSLGVSIFAALQSLRTR